MTENTAVILKQSDHKRVKKCSECEYANDKGWCSFYTLYACLRGGCFIESADGR